MSIFSQLRKQIEVTEVFLDEYILEHNKYNKIPKIQRTYRIDNGDLNKFTQDNARTYTSENNQLYAVNIDGSGHDSYHGFEIPKKDAEYFRTIGFEIAQTNILESLDCALLDENYKVYRLLVE